MRKLFVLASIICTLLINSCTTEVTKEIIVKPEIYSVGLEITNLPDTLNYLPNQNLDLSGLVIKKNMSDGTSVALTAEDYISEPENGVLLSEVGTQPVKIISDNKTVFFTINVSETILSGIEITSLPTKVDYNEREKFSSAGLVISEIRIDGNKVSKNILSNSQYTLNINENDKPPFGGDFKVIINYSNKSAFFIIHVGAKTAESYTFIDDGTHVISKLCEQNTNLKSVVIPDTIITIDESAFNGCTSLKDISLPESINTIGKTAFKNCKSIESLKIPDSVLTIDKYAFESCGFKEIQLPKNLTTLHTGTFQDCKKLEQIIFNDLLNLVSKMSFNNCKSLKEVVWSNSVEILGLAAFYGCSSLNNLILPTSIRQMHVNVDDCGYVKDYLSKLSYEGTIEEFKNIRIVGDYLNGTRIYCSDGSFVYGEE